MASGRDVIVKNPDVMRGTPRIPRDTGTARSAFDAIEADDTLDDFLNEFPGVTREMAVVAWEEGSAGAALLERLNGDSPGHTIMSRGDVTVDSLLFRIAVTPGTRSGQLCFRDLRLTVWDIVK